MSTPRRNLLVACCGFALLLFFFPLQVVEDSAGGQAVLNLTGYDALLRLVDSLSNPEPQKAAWLSQSSSLLHADWITPLAFVAAFVFAAAALAAAVKNKHSVRVLCVLGSCCAVVAILYTANVAVSAQTVEPVPPPGLARDLMADIVRHVEISLRVAPGWAAYALAATLGLGFLLTFFPTPGNLDDDTPSVEPVSDPDA
jgi:hypothetical protein